MDFSFTAEELQFRDELRHWLQDKLPEGWGETVFEPEDEDERAHFRLDWEKKLYAGGWSAIEWPEEYGGRAATPVQRTIYAQEMARARAPEGLNVIGRNLTATTLFLHGTEAQRQRFLPKIRSAEEVWCQGFSEPNAGSDLASIRCRAEQDGEDFIVNGQKIWTSFAQYSQWCILLARTDAKAPKHKGISFFLVDMSTPGISIRPLKQMSGESEFNETFFNDVRVPAENLVGNLNDGWRVAMTTLAFERGPQDAFGRQIRFQQELERLLATLSTLTRDGERVIDDPVTRDKLGKSVVKLEVLRLKCLRLLSKAMKGEPSAPEASMLKLYWSSVAQEMYEVALEALGPLACIERDDPLVVADGRFQLSYLHSLAFSIYSGSNEIQKNIIGERGLGLPR